MIIEQLQELLIKYGLPCDMRASIGTNMAIADLLTAIAELPTSTIFEFFNEIAINDVFHTKEQELLF